ncbi:MAG TPA: hypothetical protein EYH34_07790 [Planctomycetes bacterium]|nr:hypothetical protein [Planctomycetota bacterium]
MRRWARVFLVVFVLVAPSWASGRVWTDKQGNQITATFVRLHGSFVILSQGNRVLRVPMDALSPEDQQYVRRRAAGMEDQTPEASAASAQEQRRPPALRPVQEPSSSGGQEPSTDPTESSGVRTWTDVHGRTLRAEFVGVSGNQVMLRSGTETKSYPFGGFSPQDQAYIESLLKQRGQEGLVPGLRASASPPMTPDYAAMDEAGYGSEVYGESEEGEYDMGIPGGMVPRFRVPRMPQPRVPIPPRPPIPGQPMGEGAEEDYSGYEEAYAAEAEGEEDYGAFPSGYPGAEEGMMEEGMDEAAGEDPGPFGRGWPPMGSGSISGPPGSRGPRIRPPSVTLPIDDSAPDPSVPGELFVKKCTNCNAVLPPDIEIGDTCPKCGVKFEFEEGLDGKVRDASGREVSRSQLLVRRVGISTVAGVIVGLIIAIVRALQR